MTHEVMPSAEPLSVDAGSGAVGALVLHGFTGHPGSVRPVAEAFADGGYHVELPRLAGHGTSIDEMLSTGWADWLDSARRGYDQLAERCDRIVIAGLSMGGALTLALSGQVDARGIICINPMTQPLPDDVVEMVEEFADDGMNVMPGIGSDIADPDVVETAYEGTPIAPLLSLSRDGMAPLSNTYGELTTPMLLLTSREDHVVDPTQSINLANQYGGEVTHEWLERSYHVATLDFDRELIRQRVIEFASRVTA